MLEKSLHCCDWTFRGNSIESSEIKESCRESLSLLREYLGNPEQNAGRMLGVKAILMRSQIEMKNVILETGGKVIFVIKWQRT